MKTIDIDALLQTLTNRLEYARDMRESRPPELKEKSYWKGQVVALQYAISAVNFYIKKAENHENN